jgi:hypothetical protein
MVGHGSPTQKPSMAPFSISATIWTGGSVMIWTVETSTPARASVRRSQMSCVPPA